MYRAITKAKGEKLRRFEQKILRIILGAHHDPLTNRYRVRINIEIQELYNDRHIVQEC